MVKTLSIYLSTYISIYLSIDLPIYLYICLSVYLSFYWRSWITLFLLLIIYRYINCVSFVSCIIQLTKTPASCYHIHNVHGNGSGTLMLYCVLASCVIWCTPSSSVKLSKQKWNTKIISSSSSRLWKCRSSWSFVHLGKCWHCCIIHFSLTINVSCGVLPLKLLKLQLWSMCENLTLISVGM